MIKVFKKISKYDATKGTFFNWVYTIVRNTALDKIKLACFPAMDVVSETIPDIEQADPLQSLQWKDVYILLDALSPATRVVCSLFYLEGFSIKDIGYQLQVSEGTVKWHLSETRKKLKPVFEKYYL